MKSVIIGLENLVLSTKGRTGKETHVSAKMLIAPTLTLWEELAYSVNREVEDHWDNKIKKGIIPTHVLQQGQFNSARHQVEMYRLATGEADAVKKALNFRKFYGDALPKDLRYFGIGTGQALEMILPIANQQKMGVIAYDASQVGCDIGRSIIDQQAHNALGNDVYRADINFACRKKYIPSESARLLVASRVLSVLDKQEPHDLKPKHQRKMARTARRIGKLLSFLDALLIHPQPEDNPGVIWGDTTPDSLGLIAEFMAEGLGNKVEFRILGKIKFYMHTYTAALFVAKC